MKIYDVEVDAGNRDTSPFLTAVNEAAKWQNSFVIFESFNLP
jgi:hypothetical protein